MQAPEDAYAEIEALEGRASDLRIRIQERTLEAGRQLLELAGAEQRAIDALLAELIQTQRQLGALRDRTETPHHKEEAE